MLMISKDLVLPGFWSFFWALLAGAVVAMPVLRLLIAFKSRQNVYSLAPESHQKKQGTPTMGGIIILLGALVGILAVSQNWKVALWMIGFAFIGFADDFLVPRLIQGKRGLGWKQKISAQVLLAILAVPVFGLTFQTGTVILTAFLVLFFSNAYNFADGLDGLAASLGLILCVGFAALAVMDYQPALALYCAALAGGYLPFLMLNAPPAKVFMGDVGSLPIGALFGAIAATILLGPPTAPLPFGSVATSSALWGPIVVLSFVMIAELVPVPMQVGFYKLTKKRLFPMTPIHHAFEKKGWPESRVVWSFVLTQFCLGIFAVVWAFGLSTGTRFRVGGLDRTSFRTSAPPLLTPVPLAKDERGELSPPAIAFGTARSTTLLVEKLHCDLVGWSPSTPSLADGNGATSGGAPRSRSGDVV